MVFLGNLAVLGGSEAPLHRMSDSGCSWCLVGTKFSIKACLISEHKGSRDTDFEVSGWCGDCETTQVFVASTSQTVLCFSPRN